LYAHYASLQFGARGGGDVRIRTDT